MPIKTHSTGFLRAAIEARGWGDIPEPQPYSPDPIEVDTPGHAYSLDPVALTDEQEQLIADCFKLVAACLLRDEDGTYTALLEALMAGEAS